MSQLTNNTNESSQIDISDPQQPEIQNESTQIDISDPQQQPEMQKESTQIDISDPQQPEIQPPPSHPTLHILSLCLLFSLIYLISFVLNPLLNNKHGDHNGWRDIEMLNLRLINIIC